MGLVFLAAVGIATLSRAQKAGQQDQPPPAVANLLKLQTEVDVLQVEFDAERFILLENLKTGHDPEDLKNRYEAFQKKSRLLNKKKLDMDAAERRYRQYLRGEAP